MKRCFPKNDDAPLLTKYHDHEWGKLNLNENYLYEMMVLESFQSGLSRRGDCIDSVADCFVDRS